MAAEDVARVVPGIDDDAAVEHRVRARAGSHRIEPWVKLPRGLAGRYGVAVGARLQRGCCPAWQIRLRHA
jgi:hypothetical protein